MIAVSSITAVVVGLTAWAYATTPSQLRATNRTGAPPQAVLVDPLEFNVLGINGSFRQSATEEFFNPTNTTPPFFQVLHHEFLKILGPSATIRAIAANPTFAFAHEAPIWVPKTDEVFFASNDGGALGMSDIDHNNQVSKINLQDVAAAIKASGPGVAPVNVTATKIDLPEAIQMTNGGTGPFNGKLVLINSGRGPLPPSIALVDPAPPHNTTVLLDNFFGRQFNSLNDVKIHPGSNKLFFTDVTYGFLNHFRPPPLLPNQVYRFDPDTGSVRVVADGFDRCNGIAFTPDGRTAFVTDTGANGGFLGNNQTDPATIYAFDVDAKSNAFKNRRVFAYVDTGIADGIQLDAAGNVYAGTGDGVQVWDSDGTLLGKFFLGTTSANLVFAGDGRLVIMAETAIYFAEIAAKANKLSFP
ncbi:D-lactonohydrolase-like protein [Polyporus arcularius HHB13444]|uniref:D-lactonohydrolase-like protein n=1 Tax=Polyporus arcularius HHB13444 TaxID=1314778 RepID=A0A5C3PPM4_9APHY|nr:D-lactonohydrolase-like protein [Polyporus arcularius HHB13444]